MNRALHKRYLDYRDGHGYFGHAPGQKSPLMGPDAFAEADAELAGLRDKGAARTEVENKRLRELEKLLFQD
jgi:hypothetical protein